MPMQMRLETLGGAGVSGHWRRQPALRRPSPSLPHSRNSSQPHSLLCYAQLTSPPSNSSSSTSSNGTNSSSSPLASAPAAATSQASTTAAPAAPTSSAVIPLERLLPAGGTGSGPEGNGSGPKDEPEVALILLACGIGLATGACIVAFNDAVHWLRDIVWEGQPLLAGNTAVKLRDITDTDLWPRVVFPPLLGGLAVGALGFIIGGYTDSPAPKIGGVGGSSSEKSSMAEASDGLPRQGQQQQQQQGVAASASSAGGISSSSGTSSTGSSPSSGTSSTWEQWKLQVTAVVRPVSRAVAAAITLGSGASLGPEGPSVDIGTSVAKGFGSSLRSKQRHLTALIAAGSGAGVAAGFNAPISGVFFAVETVLQRQKLPRIRSGDDLAQQAQQVAAVMQQQQQQQQQQTSGLTYAMVLLACVLAAVVSQAGLGSSPAFRVPEYRLESLYELPLYLLFGAICGIVSASCSFSTRIATEAFDELREQNSFEAALTPAMGGLTTGLLALGYPEILYQGFDNVNNILATTSYAPALLIQIVVIKVIATAICRGSGLQGGLYAPSIFIGAALGTAFGTVAHAVGDPAGLTLAAPQAYALVGVAALLASNCQVPLTSVLLLFELTRDYLIILPTLAAVGISFWVSSLLAPSVKNAAAARRMTAAAAASAAVNTTQLNRAATEMMLMGSLGGGLEAGSATGANHKLTSSGAEGPNAAAPGELAAAAARAGSQLPVSAALERSCLLIEADMPVRRALDLMLADDQHVAVVLGGDGGVQGLVTRELLEECVAAAEAALGGAQAGAVALGGGSPASVTGGAATPAPAAAGAAGEE